MGAEQPRKFDLEDRAFQFATRVRTLIRAIPMDMPNFEDARQLVRCSRSVGANYIEANEGSSNKDFQYRLKVARKEAKESRQYLRLLEIDSENPLEQERQALVQEATELVLILSAILRNSS